MIWEDMQHLCDDVRTDDILMNVHADERVGRNVVALQLDRRSWIVIAAPPCLRADNVSEVIQ